MIVERRTLLGLLGAQIAALGILPASVRAAAQEHRPTGIEEPRYEQYFNARTALWASLGAVDEDVIAYLVSPEFQGAPAWPTTRQAYRVVRPEGRLILASDGLSDPFVDDGMPGAGFNCEVYLESDELAGASLGDLRTSWQFALIESFAQNVANFGGINDNLDRLGVVSFELPAPASMPERWVTERGSVGALINLTVPDRPEFCDLGEAVRIRIISLTILLPEEIDYLIEGRAAARADLAKRLVSAGHGVISSSQRASVLA